MSDLVYKLVDIGSGLGDGGTVRRGLGDRLILFRLSHCYGRITVICREGSILVRISLASYYDCFLIIICIYFFK